MPKPKAAKIDTSTWTPEQRAEFERLQGELSDEADKRAALEAQEEIRRNSPEAQIEAAKERLEAERRANAFREWEAAADAAERKARREHGTELVGRIRTEVGSIVFRGMTGDEFQEASERSQDLPPADRENIARNAIADLVVYPPRPKFDELTSKFPGLWGTIIEANTKIATCNAEVVAKKG
ncbi:hypothetical protein BE21_57510 [Sorangium cellulosum]|uniref:Uncharacterized protein n=1 Tax=Sorangium cellulosum TaxID=56 RepID=A0A150U3B0_SORCE|nr:hypothetical protein BE21_57510 [Sorangium cellulosum]